MPCLGLIRLSPRGDWFGMPEGVGRPPNLFPGAHHMQMSTVQVGLRQVSQFPALAISYAEVTRDFIHEFGSGQSPGHLRCQVLHTCWLEGAMKNA
jgi:hypothetical protein